MIDTTKENHTIYIDLSKKADRDIIFSFFGDQFKLTDKPDALKNGSVDMIIMDAISANANAAGIKTLKESVAPDFLPLLVLVGKDLNQLSRKMWDVSDDVLQIPVSKEIFKARMQALLTTRAYSRSLVEKRRKLEQSNSTLRMYFNAVEAVTSGIVITDPKKEDNPIIFCNRAFQEMTGYAEHEILGQNCRFLQNDDRNQEPLKRIREHIEREEPAKEIIRNYRKDGTMFWNELKVSPVRDKQGAVEFFVGIQNNITELVETQEKLRATRNQWQSIVTQSPDMIQISADGIIRFLNPKGAEIYGVKSPEEIIGKQVVDLFDAECREMLDERMQTLKQGGEVPPQIYSLWSHDGKRKYIKMQSVPVIYEGEWALQTVGQDITGIIRSNQELEKTVAEKQRLLQEVHHRVKNNLAVINGLIELQLIGVEVPETVKALRGAQSRILSISKVHELLYQQDSLKEIDFGQYMQELTDSIIHFISGEGQIVEFGLELVPLKLSLSQAVSCGLLFNELISNSIKHGSKKGRKLKIDISLMAERDQVHIHYRDDGRGLQNPKVLEEEGNFGMSIIRTLMKQIGADWQYKSGRGFDLSVQFIKQGYQGFI